METWSRLMEDTKGGVLIKGSGLREIVSILVGHEISTGTTKAQLLTTMKGDQGVDELQRNTIQRLKGRVACPEEVVDHLILDIRARINVTPERVQTLFSEVIGHSAREIRLELERVRAGDPAIGCLFHPMLAITAEERRALEIKLAKESLAHDETDARCGFFVVKQSDGEGVVVQPFLNTPENLARFKERRSSAQFYFSRV